LYAAVELAAGAALDVPADHEQRAVYVVAGAIEIDGTPVPEAHMAVLSPNDPARVTAQGPATIMLVGGARPDGERFIWWNFVASSRDRIETAKAKWRAQQYGAVPGDNEFIPLPER